MGRRLAISKESFIGSGSFNNAYRLGDRVIKVQKTASWDPQSCLDLPERSARLWNELNAGLATAEVVETTAGVGWSAPFIEGRQSTDVEMSTALLDIYNRTGRIVLDAYIKNNFLTTSKGEVVCVDIGLGLQSTRLRSRSVASERYSGLYGESRFSQSSVQSRHIQVAEAVYPMTVNTIRALLFISKHRPSITNVNFLVKNKALVETLAAGLVQPKKYEKMALTQLRAIMPEDNIKEACITKLKQYINSRGTMIYNTSTFSPSLLTKVFRKVALTNKKVMLAKRLIDAIEKSENNQDLKAIFSELNVSHKELKGDSMLEGQVIEDSDKLLQGNLLECLSTCSAIVENAPNQSSPSYSM